MIYFSVLLILLSCFPTQPSVSANTALSDVVLNGLYRRVNNTEYVYQLLSSNAISTPPTGLVVLLHGCSHAGTDFFPRSSSCPMCLGLPVEVHITRMILSRNMVPLALTSANRHHKCWSHEDDFHELSKILADFIKQVLPENPRIPVIYFGASSGGAYAGMLSQFGQAHGLAATGAIVEISTTHVDPATPPAHVPTMVFIHMERDRRTASGVKHTQNFLQSISIPHTSFAVSEKPLTDTFFTFENVLSPTESATLVAALRREGYLTERGCLLQDPRMSDWREVARKALPQVVPKRDSLVADESPLAELMNLAWASHEMTHEFVSEAIDFIYGQSQSQSRSTGAVYRGGGGGGGGEAVVAESNRRNKFSRGRNIKSKKTVDLL